jgi:hypothetical protein
MTSEADDFEAPEQYPTEITIKGKTRTYVISELSDADVMTTFRVTDDKGNRDARLVASFNARVIAKCVRREDGTPITADEARKMRQPLAAALVAAVLKVHQIDVTPDKAIEDAEGN